MVVKAVLNLTDKLRLISTTSKHMLSSAVLVVKVPLLGVGQHQMVESSSPLHNLTEQRSQKLPPQENLSTLDVFHNTLQSPSGES